MLQPTLIRVYAREKTPQPPRGMPWASPAGQGHPEGDLGHGEENSVYRS